MNLLFNSIDSVQLLQSLAEGESSFTFDTRIKEDCNLSNICTALFRNHDEQWSKIMEAFNGKQVSVRYSDRFLITPLGCLLLAHMISQIKEKLNINIVSLDLCAKRPSNESFSNDYGVFLDKNFSNAFDRNDFLISCMRELVGFNPSITDSGYFEHERCLTIKSDDEELSIRPDGGIAYGWKPFGREASELTQEDFEYNWDLDIRLYNQKKDYSGILYTISFNKNE